MRTVILGFLLLATLPLLGQSYQTNCTGSSSCTPTNSSGDFQLAYACRDANATAPTAASGWTSPAGWTGSINGTGSADSSCRLACRVATSSNQASGTFTNATSFVLHNYRGFKTDVSTVSCATLFAGTPQWFTSTVNTTTTTATFNAVTNTNSLSWDAGFVYAPAATGGITTAPTGMTNRSSNGTIIAGHDTNGATASFSSANVTLTTAGRIITATVEMKAPCATICADAYVPMDTGTAGDAITTTNLASGTKNIAYLNATPWFNNGSTTGFVIGTHPCTRNQTVNVAGTTYTSAQPVGAKSVRLNSASTNTIRNWAMDISNESLREVTVTGCVTITPAASSNGLFDYFIIEDAVGNHAVLQLDTGSGGHACSFNIEGNNGGTIHSSYIDVSSYCGTTNAIQFSLFADTGTGVTSLALFDASTGSQIGSTVTSTIATGTALLDVNFGNNESGSATSNPNIDFGEIFIHGTYPTKVINWSTTTSAIIDGSNGGVIY